jgi:hypothetical protein
MVGHRQGRYRISALVRKLVFFRFIGEMSRARLLSGELLRAHSGITTNVSGEPVRSAQGLKQSFRC